MSGGRKEHGDGPGTRNNQHYVTNFYHRRGGHSKEVLFYWSEVDPSVATHVVVPLGDYLEMVRADV